MSKKPEQAELVARPGMLPQDRAMLDQVVRESYERFQAAKASGMARYVVRRGPDLVIPRWDKKNNRPTKYRYGGRSWREVGVLMYGEDFSERLSVMLDSLHAERVR